jgi:hypothetical protein
VEVADGGSLERGGYGAANPGATTDAGGAARCRCSRTRWRWCNDVEDVSELELKGGCYSSHLLGLSLGGSNNAEDVGELELKGGCCSSHLLGLSLGGSNTHLEGCEGSGEVNRIGGISRGGSGHDSLLLLQHSLRSHGVLMRCSSDGLDDGNSHDQVSWSNARGSRSDGDSVEVED